MATATESKEDWETIMLAEVQRLLSEGKGGLRILVTGRTGAGKSALVNSIVGEYVAEEGDAPLGQTVEVTKYEKKIRDIVVTVYDSPGLQDGILDQKAQDAYLKDLEKNCREVDLNLFCVKMNDRMRPSEGDAIVKLSRAFGMEEFWQNTLFVLTFANEIELPKRETSFSLVEHFKKLKTEWERLLQDALINKAGITKEVAEKVPVVPAGYSDEPSLPADNSDYWLSKLWFQCLDRTDDTAKPILLNINWNRLRPSEEVKKEEKVIPTKKGYEQPINKDVAKPKTLESFFSELSMRDKSTKTAAGSGDSTPTPQDQKLQAKLGEPPTLAKLQVLKTNSKGGKKIRIINKLAANWLTLGDLLEIDDLDNIKEKCNNDPKLCCREMFNRWIKGEGVEPRTWEKLIELIDDIGDVVLANDVKNALL